MPQLHVAQKVCSQRYAKYHYGDANSKPQDASPPAVRNSHLARRAYPISQETKQQHAAAEKDVASGNIPEAEQRDDPVKCVQRSKGIEQHSHARGDQRWKDRQYWKEGQQNDHAQQRDRCRRREGITQDQRRQSCQGKPVTENSVCIYLQLVLRLLIVHHQVHPFCRDRGNE